MAYPLTPLGEATLFKSSDRWSRLSQGVRAKYDVDASMAAGYAFGRMDQGHHAVVSLTTDPDAAPSQADTARAFGALYAQMLVEFDDPWHERSGAYSLQDAWAVFTTSAAAGGSLPRGHRREVAGLGYSHSGMPTIRATETVDAALDHEPVLSPVEKAAPAPVSAIPRSAFDPREAHARALELLIDHAQAWAKEWNDYIRPDIEKGQFRTEEETAAEIAERTAEFDLVETLIGAIWAQRSRDGLGIDVVGAGEPGSRGGGVRASAGFALLGAYFSSEETNDGAPEWPIPGTRYFVDEARVLAHSLPDAAYASLAPDVSFDEDDLLREVLMVLGQSMLDDQDPEPDPFGPHDR